MPHKVFTLPSYTGESVDVLFCNPAEANSLGTVHYAYTVGAEKKDAVAKRTFPWIKIQEFAGAYPRQHPAVIDRLKAGDGYRPGEGVLDGPAGPTADTEHDTITRLGALEMLGNLSSGRLSTTDKDPFPHQLALQQYVRRTADRPGPRRLLIADEVGLGKTVEVALILRDMLLARGRIDGFRCLYLTSGGLVDDAAAKLRDVLNGVVDGVNIVDTVESFRQYGRGNTFGVHVASTHAARRYVADGDKKKLPTGVRPEVVIVDECHHAASEGDLAGVAVTSREATQTYLAVKQILAGEFWLDSERPALGILMSATPFRSKDQFVNLLRLLTDGVTGPDGAVFRAFAAGVQGERLRSVVQSEGTTAGIVWRRQSDDNVRSWSNARIFPNLTIRRPHLADASDPLPRLPTPSDQFLDLVAEVKSSVGRIARSHGQSFSGLVTAHLEKMLTSSSLAGACWLFTWAVRRCEWATEREYKTDKGHATEGLRRLLRLISQRIAQGDARSKAAHASVYFPSHDFDFPASEIAPNPNTMDRIYKYSAKLRSGDEDDPWVATAEEVVEIARLGERLLGVGPEGERIEGAQDLKLEWLRAMLARHPDERFILFTESLQTCETLKNNLGSAAVVIEGRMNKAKRLDAVEELRTPKGTARVLIATAAADEGIDLQVASKVIHWDLSSSPATLMQRNGRAARLGQVRDVEAYYLVLQGTHEERRDSALCDRFAELGIQDEALKSRILGSLSEEEEQRLEQAVQESDDRVAGDILTKAKSDNDLMDKQLADIRADLKTTQVLSRGDLADRLSAWKQLGLPESGTGDLEFEFDEIPWRRPVFEATSRFEQVVARTAKVRDEDTKQTFVFDPEFFVFGHKLHGERPKLAGLPPWVSATDRHNKHRIRPYDKGDLLGKLFHRFARLKSADFLTLPRGALDPAPIPTAARWLLFCTHPLREAENTLPPATRPYLTFYAFTDLSPDEPAVPLVAEGAAAEAVHAVISAAEKFALAGCCSDVTDAAAIQAARDAGVALRAWAEGETKFGAASFLDEEKYFIPIPVALVRISAES